MFLVYWKSKKPKTLANTGIYAMFSALFIVF